MRKSSRQANNSHERVTRGDEQREVWSASKPLVVSYRRARAKIRPSSVEQRYHRACHGQFPPSGQIQTRAGLADPMRRPIPPRSDLGSTSFTGNEGYGSGVPIEQAGDQTMRRSGVLFSLQRAARVQQVRTEIGRLLRQHYEASSPPMSGRLAEVINKLQQSTSQSDLALAADEQVGPGPR